MVRFIVTVWGGVMKHDVCITYTNTVFTKCHRKYTLCNRLNPSTKYNIVKYNAEIGECQ